MVNILTFHKTRKKCHNHKYCKVASFNASRLKAHAGFFRLLMKAIFDPYSRVWNKRTHLNNRSPLENLLKRITVAPFLPYTMKSGIRP